MVTIGKFYTALRETTRKEIEQIGSADIVVGIPCYYSADSIGHVIDMVTKGLESYYPDKKAVIIISDGGSTDDTREMARAAAIESKNIHQIVAIYRGIPGKGSAFRLIFEATNFLKAKALALFDSDLKSITPEWVRSVIDPVMEKGYDFVAPDYKRFKFDGTITNTITYNLTRALYGTNIRQPIGGDFGVSLPLTQFYLAQDIWDSDVAKFGIDIWMSTRAIVNNFKVCQARLGVKIHGEKDPAEDLSPMFYQVVGTIFTMMGNDSDYWMNIEGTKEVPIFGEFVGSEPEEFEVNKEALIAYFKVGFANFSALWKQHLADDEYATLAKLAEHKEGEKFYLDSKMWVRIVYRYAWFFNRTERQRRKIMSTLIPIYNARVASLIEALKSGDMDAEEYFTNQAKEFEALKPWLIELWKQEA